MLTETNISIPMEKAGQDFAEVWINVYPNGVTLHNQFQLFSTKELADHCAANDRLDCIHLKVKK
jgi:hypothetical protein